MTTGNNDFLAALQRYTAQAAIPASTLRKMGPAGTVNAARKFLADLSLRPLGPLSGGRYLTWLNEQTERLQRSLPTAARRWGPARKSLNIFLRVATYTSPLASVYDLTNVLPFLEVPLDRNVAIALRKEPEGAELPTWKGVIHLTRELSVLYQDVASRVALRRAVHGADLDVFYWPQ